MKIPSLILAGLLGPAALAPATPIAVGSDIDVGSGWRSGAVPSDIDGNGVLGSDGYAFVRGPLEIVNPSYGTLSGLGTSVYNGNAGYSLVDDPLTTPGGAPTTVKSGTWNPGGVDTNIARLTLNRDLLAGETIRVGLMVDNLDHVNWNAQSIRVADSSGGDSGQITLADPTENQVPDWYYFDITGLSNGATVDIYATRGINGGATIGAVSLDSMVSGPDTAPPTIMLPTSPADDASGVLVSSDLVATFDENIALTGAGTVTIRDLGPGADVVIDLSGPDPDGTVSVTGAELTINPASDLVADNSYAIQISADAVEDLAAAPNVFAGILDDTTWNFTTAASFPIAVGTKIGLAPGPTLTDEAGNDWFDFAGTGTYNTIHDLDGVTVAGVSVQVTGSVGFNTAGEDNWVGLSTNGGSAPAEFVDSVTTDLLYNNVTITIAGLDPAMSYNLYSVSHGGGAGYDATLDTHTVTGDVSYGSSTLSRGDGRLNGAFHTFLGVSPDVTGNIVLATTQPSGSNAAFNGLLIEPVGPHAPLITSSPATEVRSTSATLNGELVSQGGEVTTVWACWGDDDPGEVLDSWDNKVELGTPAVGLLSHPVTGLATDTTCHFRFFATNSTGDSWSDPQSFAPTLPQLTVSAGQALEGSSGLTALNFEVALSYPADSDVTIDYTTLHGSTDGSDFTPGTGQVTITAGQTAATITVWVNGDADEELDEQFTLRIDGANGVVVTATEIQGMILSDDGDHLSPVAVAADTASGLVYVALNTARRIAVVDATSEQFLRSIPVPGTPNGLCLNAAGTRLYVAAGGPGGQVHVIDTTTDNLLSSWDVGHTPLSPVLSPDGTTLYVCNRFNDDVSVIEVASGNTLARIPVEREPHACALNSDGNFLFVANLLPIGPATSNTIAANVSVIDTSSRTVTGTIALPTGSHSLRGMCLAPDGSSIYVTHVLSRYYVPTTQVTRGWINTNALTVIDPASATRVNTILLDDLDEGAANPWGVACSPDGAWLCVAHAGSHEISAIDRTALHTKLAAASGDTSTDLTFLAGLRERIPLGGNGPRGIAVAAGKVFAAEYFSDSLGVAELPGGAPVGREVTIGWQKPADAVRRGEMFYNDATLCLQQWQSCASCHPDARADGLNWDILNDGFGNAKNTKSHIASMATPPTTITGIRPDAQTSVRAGLRYIQFVNREESYAEAIDAFLTALQPVPSPHLVNGQLSAAARNGQAHFQSSGCANCHSGPYFTDLSLHDMGTGEEFDTPTLLEIWRSGPYLHDGRAATIRDVIETHGNTSGLSPAEIDELITYLLSL